MKILLLIIIFILLSCCYDSNSIEIKRVERIVSAKTMESYKDHTDYIVAFSDCKEINTSFGFYSILNKGDTVIFIYYKNGQFDWVKK